MNTKINVYGINRIVKSVLSLYYYPFAKKAYSIGNEAWWLYQIKQFRNIYNYSIKNIPYYRTSGYPVIDFSKIKSKGDFLNAISIIPILTKSELRDNQSQFISGQKLFTKSHATSGSTGTPVKITSTLTEKLKLQMIKNYWFKKISGSLFPKLMILTGYYQPNDPNEIYIKDSLTGDVFLSIGALRPKNREKIANLINKEKPSIIWGYASPINLLAELFEEEKLSIDHKMIAASTSEVLRDSWREKIEKNLVSRIYNFYSSQECTHGVFEHHDGAMKINPVMGLLETLDENYDRKISGTGKVVGTGYFRKKMPFIRYELGDEIESFDYSMDRDTVPNWPRIGQVYGRSDDSALRKDGSRVGDLFSDRAIKKLDQIIEAQFIQKNYDHFICKIVCKPNSNTDFIERNIKNSVEDSMGYPTTISFEYVQQIERGKNQKLRSLIVDFKSGVL